VGAGSADRSSYRALSLRSSAGSILLSHRTYWAINLGLVRGPKEDDSMRTDRSAPVDPSGVDVRRRALLLWPGLDRRKLSRTGGRPRRVARLVERRTSLTVDVILGMLS
jgi:hypothetical protein